MWGKLFSKASDLAVRAGVWTWERVAPRIMGAEKAEASIAKATARVETRAATQAENAANAAARTATKNLDRLNRGSFETVEDATSALTATRKGFERQGKIVANIAGVEERTAVDAMKALQRGEKISYAEWNNIAEGVEAKTRHHIATTLQAERHLAGQAGNAAQRGQQVAEKGRGFIGGTMDALKTYVFKPLIPFVAGIGGLVGLDYVANDGRIIDYVTKKGANMGTRLDGDTAATQVSTGVQQAVRDKTAPISDGLDGGYSQAAPTAATPNQNRLNLAEVFSNLQEYGNFSPKELDAMQSAYNKASGADNNLDLSNAGEKAAFVDGLKSLPTEKKQAVFEAFGLNK